MLFWQILSTGAFFWLTFIIVFVDKHCGQILTLLKGIAVGVDRSIQPDPVPIPVGADRQESRCHGSDGAGFLHHHHLVGAALLHQTQVWTNIGKLAVILLNTG